MRFFKIFISLMLSTYAHAGIEFFLKKAEGKSDIHSMRNIDFIYMINLDKRTEKFSRSVNQLHLYGIYPYRFSAVNGWMLPLETINGVGLKYQMGMTPLMATTYPLTGDKTPVDEWMSEWGKTYFCHTMTLGSIGCALSHISVLQDAWDSGYETIWVLEDDIEVIANPSIIPDLIDRLDALVGKDNWDVLFTDQNYRKSKEEYLIASGYAERPDMDCSLKARYNAKYTETQEISPDFRKIGARFATHSMVIRRSGIQKLLTFAKEHQIFLSYDLDNYLAEGLQRYSLTYDVVSNLIDAPTDNAVSSLSSPYNTIDCLPYHPHGWYRNGPSMEELIRKRGVKTVIEVGSWLGLSTCHIAKTIPSDGIVYAVDHWMGSPNEDNSSYDMQNLYKQFLSNVIHEQLTHKIVPVKMSSEQAANTLQIHPDMVYLDASHDFWSVYQDLTLWFPFVQGHGVLCGDDYYWGHTWSVKSAVDTFALQNNLIVHEDGWMWYLEEQP